VYIKNYNYKEVTDGQIMSGTMYYS